MDLRARNLHLVLGVQRLFVGIPIRVEKNLQAVGCGLLIGISAFLRGGNVAFDFGKTVFAVGVHFN